MPAAVAQAASLADEGLDGLVEALRTAGFKIGVSEAMEAALLVQRQAELAPEGPADPRQLQLMLRCIFCKSQAGVKEFDGLYENWARRRLSPVTVPTESTNSDGSKTEKKIGPDKQPEKRPRFARMAALALVILTVGYFAIDRQPDAPPPQVGTERPPPRVETPDGNVGGPQATAPLPTASDLGIYGYFQISRHNEVLQPGWVLALLSIPLLGLLPLLLLRIAQHRQGPSVTRSGHRGSLGLEPWPPTRHASYLVPPLPAQTEGQLARHVRGRPEDRSYFARRPKLDTRRTVEATLKQLGSLSPQYRYARLRPSFLVLVHIGEVARSGGRSSETPHPGAHTHFGLLWAQRLRRLDVRVDLFTFATEGDDLPPTCDEVGGTHRRFRMDGLPNPEPGQRLILIASIAALFQQDGQPQAWLDAAELRRWPQRTLFTPDDPRYWEPEAVNHLELQGPGDPGMLVYPLDDNALSAWSDWLVSGQLRPYALMAPQPFPRQLERGESRYVDLARIEPSGLEDLAELLRQLQSYLGENGFYWLCACAVPPKLDQTLALILGEEYFLRCGASEARTRHHMARNWPLLVRLPWLRDENKQMPDWLRLALLSRLPADIQAELREVVTGALGRRRPAAAGTAGSDITDEAPQSLLARDSAAEALYVGFLDDRLDAAELALRMPGEWRTWLRTLAPSQALRWRQRLRARLQRPWSRQGVPGLGASTFTWMVVPASLLLCGGLAAWLALRFHPETLDPSTRRWLTESRVYERPFVHQSVVSTVQFSPDGLKVLTASWDGTARVWDAATGAPLTAPLKHDDWVRTAVFSPDGRKLLTASDDGTAKVWDAATGAPLTAPLKHDRWVRTAVFSPDGRKLLTASDDGTARVWDALTGAPLVKPLKHDGHVRSAVFSPDGRKLLTASSDSTARVWDTATGAPLVGPLKHDGIVYSAVFSPDGLKVLTASADDTARIWDTMTGAPLTGPLEHDKRVNSAVFSTYGNKVLTASDDGTARVWDAVTGAPLAAPLKHDGAVSAAVFSPDGRKVLTASDDDTARIWNAVTGAPLAAPLKHGGWVYAAVFSPDGRKVLTASWDGTARVWDAAPSAPLAGPLKHGGDVQSAVFSPDGHKLLTASRDGTARIWDAVTGAPLVAPLKHNDVVFSATFSSDGRKLATASYDRTARVWNAATGAPLTAPLKHAGDVNAAVFSPDGRKLVTASDDHTARVWDTATGTPLTAPLKHTRDVYSAVFSADGRKLVTASFDGTARVWDTATGAPL
ncbi:MAG TPA: WD40 repeat domain-containing protein, partial [Solimonas sp.]|nr:WD40 repeat domain-containing protein [Solimonas sp.]